MRERRIFRALLAELGDERQAVDALARELDDETVPWRYRNEATAPARRRAVMARLVAEVAASVARVEERPGFVARMQWRERAIRAAYERAREVVEEPEATA